MITHQLALIRREVWEHRSIYVAPIAVAVVMSLISIAGMVTVSAFDNEIRMAILGASNIAGDAERQAAMTVFFLGTSWIFLFSLAILTVFYTLDSLYAERKDKSILFWRSLPVTDAETVISKLLTAIVVLPLVTVVAIIVTHLLNLVASSVWIAVKGGDAGHLVWGSVALLDNWLAAFIVTFASALWMSPFIGWFLFVSAWTKRSPLLMAFMPLILVPLIELIILRSSFFAEAVFGRGGMMPLFRGMDMEGFFDKERMQVNEELIRLLGHLDIVKFIASPSLWVGVIVCGLLTTAAIYVRRYRDES
ncbi:MAG: ABC-2 transporter permease [Planctomycetota bacterium]|nr:ABC-2 transporter permease [Planctomycetota bacterium]